MLDEFNEVFANIDPDKPPRPELLGHNRFIRHLHQLERVLTLVHNEVSKGRRLPVPEGPVTAYELWEQRAEDRELDALFGDIFQADPKALGMIIE